LKRLFGILIFYSLLFSACNTPLSLTKPEERFAKMEKTLPVSDIVIPISMKKENLEQYANHLIDSLDYSNFSFEQEGWQVDLKKTKDLQLGFGEGFINMKVPLDVNMMKETLLADVRAEGLIALELQTEYTIYKDWTYKTDTELVNYKWIEEPKLQLGIINLSIERLSDMLIERLKGKALDEIDLALQKHLALDQMVKKKIDEWKNLVQLEENYNTWLSFFPKRISLNPLVESGDAVETALALSSQFEISVFQKPNIEVDTTQLPQFSNVSSSNKNSNLNVKVVVPFEFINAMVDQQLIGQTFESGNRNVTIKSLSFFTQDDKLMVDSELTGSYEGHAYFSGIPTYDKSKELVYLKDFDFDLETKNFVQKTMAWLFKNKIKDRIEDQLKYALAPALAQVKDQLKSYLSKAELPLNLKAESEINKLDIGNFYLTKEALISFINLEAKIELKD